MFHHITWPTIIISQENYFLFIFIALCFLLYAKNNYIYFKRNTAFNNFDLKAEIIRPISQKNYNDKKLHRDIS